MSCRLQFYEQRSLIRHLHLPQKSYENLETMAYAVFTHNTHLPEVNWHFYCTALHFSIVKWHLPRVNVSRVNKALDGQFQLYLLQCQPLELWILNTNQPCKIFLFERKLPLTNIVSQECSSHNTIITAMSQQVDCITVEEPDVIARNTSCWFYALARIAKWRVFGHARRVPSRRPVSFRQNFSFSNCPSVSKNRKWNKISCHEIESSYRKQNLLNPKNNWHHTIYRDMGIFRPFCCYKAIYRNTRAVLYRGTLVPEVFSLRRSVRLRLTARSRLRRHRERENLWGPLGQQSKQLNLLAFEEKR